MLVSGGKRGKNEVNLLYVESESNHSQYSSPVEALNLIVQSKSLPAEVNDLTSVLYLLVEVKEKFAIICSVYFDFLSSVRSYHNTMMRFAMTFDDTLREGSSFDCQFMCVIYFVWYFSIFLLYFSKILATNIDNITSYSKIREEIKSMYVCMYVLNFQFYWYCF